VQANFIQKLAKEDPSKFQLQASAWSHYRRFFRYIWQQKWRFLIGSSTVFGLAFLQVLTPQVTRYIIDVVIPEARVDLVLWLGGAILGIAIAIGLLNFIRNYTLAQVGQEIIYQLRNELYQHLQSLSLSYFENQRTGTLMTRLTKDVESVEKLITTDVAEIIAETFTFFAIVAYLFYADWQLTLLLLITLPIMIALSQFFGSQMRGGYREIQTQSAAISNHLQETLTNVKLVKACANEQYEIDRFDQHNRAYRDANLTVSQLWAGFMPVIDVMNSLGSIIVLSYGTWQVVAHQLTIGELTAFLAYLGQINQPAKRYSRVLNVLQKGATALERIFEILDTVPKITQLANPIALPNFTGKVEFQQVSFAYQNDRSVLHQIDLSLEPGTTVALVGSSGAGKTTIANLAARFYDPITGQILMDGIDLRQLDLTQFRKQLGIVSQETLLLHSTVRENIAYGNPQATVADIESAAKSAYAHEFIQQLPQGYDTIIGERGVKLSGGQRQRLAIARALIADPKFLILDEATAALDTESEHLIQQALQFLLRDRTCLVIAHRLSTIQSANQIVVLEAGKIIEQGSHVELLAHQQRYHKLYQLQFPQTLILNSQLQSSSV
jgi:ABC-type multidrug transport system fused ATPase/permease subunit